MEFCPVLVAIGMTLSLVGNLRAQSPITFQYIYDDLNQLVKVTDSTGILIQYVYDPVGNILQVNRSTVAPGSLTVLGFTPQQGGPLSTITITGQGFSTTPSANLVRFAGATATVLSATGTVLVVTVPAAAITGPMSVTVSGHTVTSPTNFIVVPIPAITSIAPITTIAGKTVPAIVTGINLASATFDFVPPFGAGIGVVSINSAGTSAMLSVTVPASTYGRFALVATNTFGSSTAFLTASNAFGIISSTNNGSMDSDGDGLSDAQEILFGTDPFNPDTDEDGFSDGVEIASGSDPLNPSCTPLTCRVSSEADSVTFSSLNTASPAGQLREADSITFSVCNRSIGVCPGFTHSGVPPSTAARKVPGLRQTSHAVGSGASIPTIVAIIPPRNATRISPDSPVTVIFSEPIDPFTLTGETIQLSADDRRLDPALSISSDFRAVTLAADLPPEKEVRVVISGNVYSLFGRALPLFQSVFRTGARKDSSLIEMYPGSGSGAVPRDGSVVLRIDKARREEGIRVIQNGVAVHGLARSEGDIVEFKPDAPFLAGAAVDIWLGNLPQPIGAFVTDGRESSIPAVTRAFEGESDRPVIEVEYNRPLDPATINNTNVRLRRVSDDTEIPSIITTRGDRVVRILPGVPLSTGSAYYYELSDLVQDQSGASAGSRFRRTFIPQGAVTTPLAITDISPPDGSISVKVSSPILIRSNLSVNPLSVSDETIRLTSRDRGKIPMSISFANKFREVVLKPLAPLPEGQEITLTISGVEDGAGNVVAPRVIQFLTARPRPPSIAKNRAVRRPVFFRGQR